MKSRTTEDSIAVIGGALLGAAVMYLLDPELGDRRRQKLAQSAIGAQSDAQSMASSRIASASRAARDASSKIGKQARSAHGTAADYASHLAAEAREIADRLSHHANVTLGQDPAHAVDQARHVGGRWFDRVSHVAQDQLGHLQDYGHQLWERARGLANQVPDVAVEQGKSLRDRLNSRTQDLRKAAAQRVSQASHATQSWLGHEEQPGIGAGTLLSSTVGCLAIGAGVMYLFDPEKGQRRRDWLLSAATECVQSTGKTMRGIGQSLASEFNGAASQAGGAVRRYADKKRVDSEDLINRIRSEMGTMSTRASNVQFMADADGVVTVSGNIAQDEVDYLLSLLNRVPGVTHVVNRLVVSDTTPSATTLQ